MNPCFFKLNGQLFLLWAQVPVTSDCMETCSCYGHKSLLLQIVWKRVPAMDTSPCYFRLYGNLFLLWAQVPVTSDCMETCSCYENESLLVITSVNCMEHFSCCQNEFLLVITSNCKDNCPFYGTSPHLPNRPVDWIKMEMECKTMRWEDSRGYNRKWNVKLWDGKRLH